VGADARTPAFPAGLARCRLWGQMLEPPQSLQVWRCRLFMGADARTPAVLAVGALSHVCGGRCSNPRIPCSQHGLSCVGRCSNPRIPCCQHGLSCVGRCSNPRIPLRTYVQAVQSSAWLSPGPDQPPQSSNCELDRPSCDTRPLRRDKSFATGVDEVVLTRYVQHLPPCPLTRRPRGSTRRAKAS
jgi:hypothetical protein